MMEPPRLEPIEPHVRDQDPPDDGILLVRAGPFTAEEFLEHAVRQQRDYSYRGKAVASISVAAAGSGWPVDRILKEQLWSRSTYATTTVGTVRTAGYEFLATHRSPHYDIILPSATIEAASTLLSLFGVGTTNPFRRRTR